MPRKCTKPIQLHGVFQERALVGKILASGSDHAHTTTPLGAIFAIRVPPSGVGRRPIGAGGQVPMPPKARYLISR